MHQRGGFRLKPGALHGHASDAALIAGSGTFGGRVLGFIPVVTGSGPDVDEASMVRYLAETVWLPYALLPSPHLHWESIDERGARAVLSFGGRSVAGVFVFDELARPSTFDAERGRDVDGRCVRTKWHIVLGSTSRIAGVEIPTSGAVSWILDEGVFEYGRFEITELTFEL